MKIQYLIVGIIGVIISVGLGLFLSRLDSKRHETKEKETDKDDKQ